MALRYLLLILFIHSSYVVGSNENERAALSWVLFDDRKDFQHTATTSNPLFLESRGIPGSNTFHLNGQHDLSRGKDSFSNQMSRALETIKNAQSPELTIMLTSHGDVGAVACQTSSSFTHKKLIETINSTIRATSLRSPLKLHLIYTACHAGSLIDVMKEHRLEKATKVYVYAASDSSELANITKMNQSLHRTLSTTKEKPDGTQFFDAWRSLYAGMTEDRYRYTNGTSAQWKQTFQAWTNDLVVLNKPKDLSLIINHAFKLKTPGYMKYAYEEMKKDPQQSLKLLRDLPPSQKSDALVVESLLNKNHTNPEVILKILTEDTWEHLQANINTPEALKTIKSSLKENPTAAKRLEAGFEKLHTRASNLYIQELLEDPIANAEILKLHPKTSQIGYAFAAKNPGARTLLLLELMELDPSVSNLISKALRKTDSSSHIREYGLTSEDLTVRFHAYSYLASEGSLTSSELESFIKEKEFAELGKSRRNFLQRAAENLRIRDIKCSNDFGDLIK